MDLLLSCVSGVGRILPILWAVGQRPQFLARWAALHGSYNMAATVHHSEGVRKRERVSKKLESWERQPITLPDSLDWKSLDV